MRTKQSKIPLGYFKGMRVKRFFLEILLPLIITVAILILYFIFISGTESISERVTKINSSIATVIAIQVGFNITCLALIASFGKETTKITFSHSSEADRKKSMHQIVSSYIYGIFVYVSILFLGFMHITILEPLSNTGLLNLKGDIYFTLLKVAYLGTWSFLILHGFAVFLRNAKLIQLYLLVNIKNS